MSKPINITDVNICKSEEKNDENNTCEIDCISELSDDSLFLSNILKKIKVLESKSLTYIFNNITTKIEPKLNSPPISLV